MRKSNTDRAGDGEREYYARSLSEAGYIYLQQIPLLTITGKPGSARYVFSNKDSIASRAAQEYQEDRSVGAQSYSAAMAQLRRQADEILGRRDAGKPKEAWNPAMQNAMDAARPAQPAERQRGADNSAPPSPYSPAANAARQL
jgi:hypothetical protein